MMQMHYLPTSKSGLARERGVSALAIFVVCGGLTAPDGEVVYANRGTSFGRSFGASSPTTRCTKILRRSLSSTSIWRCTSRAGHEEPTLAFDPARCRHSHCSTHGSSVHWKRLNQGDL